MIIMWKDTIKKKDEEGGSTGRRSYTNKVRDTRSAESYKTGDTRGNDLASRFKTSRADFMKEVPTAYKSLQKAILHLEIIGHDIMSEAIDGHRPMSSLDLDSYEVIEVLKEFKTALIKINADSKSEK